MQRVAVLGGGVAGLTAADELSHRHFEVDVFEHRDQLGGKARSFLSKPPLPGLGQLPAEHGFRFIPGFYRHLPDSMRKIPYQGNSTVYDNLTQPRDFALLRPGKTATIIPASAWGLLDPDGVQLSFKSHPFISNFGLSPEDLDFLINRLHDLLRTCHERRLAELEATRWWDYCRADERSLDYKTMMRAMTRSLVAARADEMSARTGGDILVQLQLAEYKFHGHPDRLLNGPTSDVWIEPWRQKLASAGVNFYLNHEVTGFNVDRQNIVAVRVKDTTGEGKERDLTGYDCYVCALPVEVMQQLVDDNIKEAAPSLANLRQLVTRWMNGFMLYLRSNPHPMNGHSIYVDSLWALTSVSQAQFWASQHLNWVKPGIVEDVLSVDISDWRTNGSYVNKPAFECSPDEIRREVIGQLREYSYGADRGPDLSDDNIAGYFIDPDIVQPNPSVHVNLEPLFINTASSWANRPESRTEIDNLFLASDYVRTYTDLATMEGANEAARRAVNCILEKANSKEPPCELWAFREPDIFSPERHSDRDRYEKDHTSEFTSAKVMLEALRAAHSR
jgi:uncharacterized protein with NAD-binding domain and iron-sulfur cluster